MTQKRFYHGTEINRGKLMIKNQKMISSIGDKHWLGNGSYFYEEDFYAYKWIKDMYKNATRNQSIDTKELFNEYQILIVNTNIISDKVFNLDTAKHKIEYDRVYEQCMRKMEYSKRFSRVKMPEGVVLNIMFDFLEYDKRFDVVVATFTLRMKNYKGMKMRLNYMPEKQICFKNLDVIKDIGTYYCEDKIEEFEYYIDNLNYKNKSATVNIYSKSKARRKLLKNNYKKC